MKKWLFFYFLLWVTNISFAQANFEKIAYVVDSILLIEDPKAEDLLLENHISDINVIRNKDSLLQLNFKNLDGVIYIFTKEYRKRPDEIKMIPSSKQMERKDGLWYYKNNLYSGKFIDYYLNGKKEGEGFMLNGLVDGPRIIYFQNGSKSVERKFTNGRMDGESKEFYSDGNLKQKGLFINGKEDGIWEKYFPNGQVSVRFTFINGQMEGETISYYSNGSKMSVQTSKNGKITHDKNTQSIYRELNKGNEFNAKGNFNAAIKSYSKAIEIDPVFPESYFSRGTIYMNNFQFDKVIADFDEALNSEPFHEKAIANRAFARIRKYQFASGKTLSKNKDITVIASKDIPDIPESEWALICKDLEMAQLLNKNIKMVNEAYRDFCENLKNKN